MNVLYKGMPKVKGVWEIIDNWMEFRKECIINGLNYECDKIRKELHLLYGIKNILIDIDKAIEIIRFSKHYKNELMKYFKIDEVQAEYILKLTLRDINKDFIKEKTSKIKELEKELNDKLKTINNDKRLSSIILDDIRYISNKFKTKRRTDIIKQFTENKLANKIEIQDYNLNIVLSKEGYLKKVKLTSLRGASEYKFKDGDELLSLRQTSNKNDLLVFTSKQNCYKLKIHEIQDHKPSSLGLYLPSHLQLNEDEYIIDALKLSLSKLICLLSNILYYKNEILTSFEKFLHIHIAIHTYL